MRSRPVVKAVLAAALVLAAAGLMFSGRVSGNRTPAGTGADSGQASQPDFPRNLERASEAGRPAEAPQPPNLQAQRTFPRISIPRALWKRQEAEMIGMDFSLKEDADLFLQLSPAERENLITLMARFQAELREQESLRAKADSPGSLTVKIPALEKSAAEQLRARFQKEAAGIIGPERAEFLLTAGDQQGALIAHGNFGAVARAIVFQRGKALPGGGGGGWQAVIMAGAGVASDPSPDGVTTWKGELTSHSFYFDEIPPSLAHLVEKETLQNSSGR